MEKYYLSKLKDLNFSKGTSEIYNLTSYNVMQYPDYYKWFYLTNIPRIINNQGEAIIYLDGFIVSGLIILKNTLEKKICTLLINENYRKNGLANEILEDSFKILGTDKPLITIPQNRISEFQSIINHYNWVQTDEIDDYYSKEIVFNKVLTLR